MSATTGRIERRTTSFRASPARLSGTATRAISQPASCRSSIWRIVASTSWVRVVHIDCTATGAPSPIAVPPTQTRFDLRRGRGDARSSGRLRSTSIALTNKVQDGLSEAICPWRTWRRIRPGAFRRCPEMARLRALGEDQASAIVEGRAFRPDDLPGIAFGIEERETATAEREVCWLAEHSNAFEAPHRRVDGVDA